MLELVDWKAGWDRTIASAPPRALGVLIIVAGFLVSLAVNLPGHMSYDSVLQLAQGRSGVFNEWHPPVMAWLLGLGDGLVRGTGLFVLFNSLLLFGSLLAFLLLSQRPSWAAPALALVLVVTPVWLIYPGIVWKDVLFAAAALAGFAALAWADARWSERRARLGLIGLAFALLSLAALSRQNGAVVLPAAALALGWSAACASPPAARIRAAAAYGLIPLVLALALVVTASEALHARTDGEPSTAYQLEDLQTYDLAAALKLEPGLRLDVLQARAPELERLIRTEAVPAYTPERIDSLTAMPDLETAIFDAPEGAVMHQWLELMLRHPGLYLQVRAAAFRWVLLTPDIDSCVPFFVGVEGPDPWMAQLHMTNHERPQDKALEAYGDLFTPTPVFWHGFYALAAVALIIVLVRRRGPGDLAVAAMLAAALAFAGTFFVISVACDYRYLYFLDVAAMAAALYLVAKASWGGPAQRRPRGSSD
jgi:4-amino-4-deoxy-L-arabinose transferase-like glycosyltransferase